MIDLAGPLPLPATRIQYPSGWLGGGAGGQALQTIPLIPHAMQHASGASQMRDLSAGDPCVRRDERKEI